MKIKTQEDHTSALVRLDFLMNGDPHPNSKKGRQLIRLAKAIEVFERNVLSEKEASISDKN